MDRDKIRVENLNSPTNYWTTSVPANYRQSYPIAEEEAQRFTIEQIRAVLPAFPDKLRAAIRAGADYSALLDRRHELQQRAFEGDKTAVAEWQKIVSDFDIKLQDEARRLGQLA